VQHADRVHEVEASAVCSGAERRPQQVTLDDLGVLEPREHAPRSLDRVAQIEADDLVGAVLGREVRMPSSAAARVEHPLAAEEIPADGLEPVEELRLVFRVHLGEVLPLEPEGSSGPSLLLDEIGRNEPRYAAPDLPPPAAPGAD
jgi:hypothetical protein